MMQQRNCKTKFKWWPCPLVLSSDSPPESRSYLSLKSEACFYDINDEEFEIEIVPEMQQDLLFDQETGFNWHKSWLIPNIRIKTNLSAVCDQNQQALQCTITSCYPLQTFGMHHLQEVKLQGQNQLSISGQSITFSNLKFTNTSFKLQGAAFSLLVVVALETNGVVLKSVISSPIHIDSRKEARPKKSALTEGIQTCKFNEALYVYQNLEWTKVDNNLQGFVRYYSAPNIRFKSKHPFYLCYKFSHCFSLFYNANIIEGTSENEICSRVWEAVERQQTNTTMILCSYLSLETKKRIIKILANWRIPFIHLSFNSLEVPPHFKNIPSKFLPGAYKECSGQRSKGKTPLRVTELDVRSSQNYFLTEIPLQ